jgi:hypothetical protein
MMMRKCSVCNEDINPKRLEILPNTQTCVQHSTVEKKVAITVQMGTGDHTWTETFAVEREEYDRLEEMKGNFKKATASETKSESTFINVNELNEWDLAILDNLGDDDDLEKEEQDLDDITGE